MIRILGLVLLMLSLPLRAAAQTECDAILALAQLQAGLERVAAPGHRRVATDMDMIRRTLLRVDGDNVTFALRDHTLGGQSENIRAFLALAQTASSAFDAGRADQMIAYLHSEEPRRLSIIIGLILRPYPCRESADRVSTGLRQIELSGTEQLSPVTFSRRQVLLSFGLSITLTGLCVFIIKRQVRRLALKRRRQKRYYVDIRGKLVPSHRSEDIQNTGLWERVDVVDISSEGAKVLLWDELSDETGQKVTILLYGKPYKATVVWSNSHYAGLKFVQRIAFPALRKLVKQHPPRGRIIRLPRRRGTPPSGHEKGAAPS